jgi:hypothetical protein
MASTTIEQRLAALVNQHADDIVAELEGAILDGDTGTIFQLLDLVHRWQREAAPILPHEVLSLIPEDVLGADDGQPAEQEDE